MFFFTHYDQRSNASLRHKLLALSLLLFMLCWSHFSVAQENAAPTSVAIPLIHRHVTDQAQMLTPEQRDSLEASLSIYEQTKGTQIVVLTIPTTAPEAIEQYGIRVAEAWKVGRKDIADGIIILIAKDNPPELRRLRIEVGKGLEGAVPDAIAKRIIDETIVPLFQQGDYYGGLVAGITRIRAAVEGEGLAAPTHRAQNQQGVSKWFPVILFLFFFGVLLLTRIGGREIAHLSGNRRARQNQYSNHNILLPAILGGLLGSSSRGGGFGGGGGGGFSGGGGDFGGGGASGNW